MPSFIYYIQKSVAAAQLVRAHVRKRAFHLELIPTDNKHQETCILQETCMWRIHILHQWRKHCHKMLMECSNFRVFATKEGLWKCLLFIIFQYSQLVLCQALSNLVAFGPMRISVVFLHLFNPSLKSQVQMLETLMSLAPRCRRESEQRQPCLQSKCASFSNSTG
jgi:hypothetical protein